MGTFIPIAQIGLIKRCLLKSCYARYYEIHYCNFKPGPRRRYHMSSMREKNLLLESENQTQIGLNKFRNLLT